mmetsp:Transcript_5553/g.17536  ORF Transcript_5553/g.17536 Transcript_5553/m.17536 type:complete len:86 (+) Transcript_5553:52-309(+)
MGYFASFQKAPRRRRCKWAALYFVNATQACVCEASMALMRTFPEPGIRQRHVLPQHSQPRKSDMGCPRRDDTEPMKTLKLLWRCI